MDARIEVASQINWALTTMLFQNVFQRFKEFPPFLCGAPALRGVGIDDGSDGALSAKTEGLKARAMRDGFFEGAFCFFR